MEGLWQELKDMPSQILCPNHWYAPPIHLFHAPPPDSALAPALARVLAPLLAPAVAPAVSRILIPAVPACAPILAQVPATRLGSALVPSPARVRGRVGLTRYGRRTGDLAVVCPLQADVRGGECQRSGD